MTLAVCELLARRACRDGARRALVIPASGGAGRIWSYRALDDQVERVAAALCELAVAQGDRVAACLRNGAEYIALYHALARIGAILVGVNWRLAAPEIAHILADATPRMVLCNPEFLPAAGPAAAELSIPLMTFGDETQGGLDGVGRFEARIEESGPRRPRSVAPDLALAICYTSGTTGRPKGAVLTHAQLAAAAETIEATVDYRLHDVNLIATPLFHVGGLSFATLFAARGAAAVVPRGWVAAEILEAIATHRVNHFFAVPGMLDSLLAAEQFALADLSSVRWIMTGAAPLSVRLIDAYLPRGIPLMQSYGSTETGGPATCVDADQVTAVPSSIGRPFFRTDVRVVTASGAAASAGELGELHVRAPHVFAGYWNNPTATREALIDGWLVTGDVGYRDPDGWFYLVDRKKEVIISGGENIYPAEVEQVLVEHPAIAEVGVVGVADARWGEAVCAVVVLRSGMDLDLSAVRGYCRGRLASYKWPAYVVASVTPLPRNATGKLIKEALRLLAARKPEE